MGAFPFRRGRLVNFCEGSSVGIFVVVEMLIGGATVGSFCEFTKKLYLCRAFWNEIGRTK